MFDGEKKWFVLVIESWWMLSVGRHERPTVGSPDLAYMLPNILIMRSAVLLISTEDREEAVIVFFIRVYNNYRTKCWEP